MLCYGGKLSIYCFIISFSVVSLLIFELTCLPCAKFFETEKNIWWYLPLHFLVINILLRVIYKGFTYQVAIRSVFLGSVFAVGVFVIYYASKIWSLFGWYLCFMSFFHFSEFLAIAWCNPKTLSIDSFILNHSIEYAVAALVSWIEFIVEAIFFPSIKSLQVVSILGIIVCIVGETLRKTAMVTARTNFNHFIQTEREVDHKLVTYGVYSICRHPSYVGWFYWSIGTQVILINPICIIAYTIASWKFFKGRIVNEEETLLCFFGKEYHEYQKSVGTGLPGIKGFVVEE